MPEQNPYSAPQITEHVIRTTAAPVNRRKRQHPWEEPLHTKLLTIARLQRVMMRYTGVLALATVAIGAWVITQQRDFPSSIGEVLLSCLLLPVFLVLIVTVYQLVALLEDGDSPLFLALAVLVPGFNLLLIFYVDNLAIQYLRESEIASGWFGITPEQFAAQVELLRAAASTPQAAASLPVAEAVDPG